MVRWFLVCSVLKYYGEEYDFFGLDYIVKKNNNVEFLVDVY